MVDVAFPELRGSMAKKGGDRKPHISQSRRDVKTVAEFREEAKQLAAQAAALDELANIIEEAGFKRLNVDGVRKLPNAMKLVRTYVGNVQIAFINERNRN